MPYAHNGQISTDPIEGGIEITQAQYQQALAGMLNGMVVSIDGGFSVDDPKEPEAPEPEPITPAPVTIYSTLDYFNKFTDDEYAAARSGPMAIQRGLDMLIAAQFVDVGDPRVADYLGAMVSAGIIDETRKAELLSPQEAA